jgi:hypothetical protein
MATLLFREKKPPSATRKCPWIPRVGLYIDFGNFVFGFRQISLLEAMLNLPERGITMAQLLKVLKEQAQDIQFPSLKKREILDTSFKTID